MGAELRNNSFEFVWLKDFRELHKLVARLHVFYMYLTISGWSDVVYMTTLHVFTFALSCLGRK